MICILYILYCKKDVLRNEARHDTSWEKNKSNRSTFLVLWNSICQSGDCRWSFLIFFRGLCGSTCSLYYPQWFFVYWLQNTLSQLINQMPTPSCLQFLSVLSNFFFSFFLFFYWPSPFCVAIWLCWPLTAWGPSHSLFTTVTVYPLHFNCTRMKKKPLADTQF